MKDWAAALGMTGIGFFIAGSIIGGLLGGMWLDEKFGTRPVFLVIGLVLGIAFAFFGVYNILKPIMDNMKNGGENS
ncbi:AtpZ/AtpI family protein [Chloroflexota bacterium]